ncbi:MAG TPA: cell cycle transcriptional regulator TrcR [Stellaceae bacterium]
MHPTQPLMPKATAVWLVENTSLTFDQIGEFCGLHPLEVQAIADGEVAVQMIGIDPIANMQVTMADIERCQADPAARLRLLQSAHPEAVVKHKGPRYTPIAKRQDKPDAIAWLTKSHPELSDAQISKLVGTTKPTIDAVRERSHWNHANIKPRHPVALGLCTLEELEDAVNRANRGKRNASGEPVVVTVAAPTFENEDTAAE